MQIEYTIECFLSQIQRFDHNTKPTHDALNLFFYLHDLRILSFMAEKVTRMKRVT